MKKRKFGILIIIIGMLFLLTSCIEAWEVKFELGYDGLTLERFSVIDGETISEPEEPTREGYIFIEWQLNGEKFDFDTKITSNTTLVAKWGEAARVVTVEFNSDGGSLTDPQIIPLGTKVTKPVDPTKEGYVFGGWYLEGVEFNFNAIIEENIFLVAKWLDKTYLLVLPDFITANKEDLTKISNNEEVVLTINLPEGIILKELLVNGVDVLSEVVGSSYTFIMKEDVLVEGVLEYQLVEGIFIPKQKETAQINEGDVSSYFNISNEGSSALSIFYNSNSSTYKNIFNNDGLEVRLYPGSTNGGSLTIKVAEGHQIEKIEIETSVQNAGFSVNGEGNYTFIGKEIIELLEVSDEVEIKNIANATSGNRVDIKSITVFYNKALKTGDIVSPEITLNVGVSLNFYLGDIWDKEAALLWVTVWDNVDGFDLVVSLNDDLLYEALVVNGVLKFDKEGTYQIVYSAVDSSGNTSNLVITIRVYSGEVSVLEDLDFSGFNNYYKNLNSSSDVIFDLAYLLRDTIRYQQYGVSRYLFVPYTAGSDKQAVLYDYPARDNTYKLIPFNWGNGGVFTLSNGRSVKLEREHVWPASDMLIRPNNNSKSNTTYVPYELNINKAFDYRPDNANRGHYTDMHNLWLSIGSANGTHSNYYYGEENGQRAAYYLSNQVFYPGDEYIGDIARILFYMTLMYPYLTLVEKNDPKAGVLNNIYYGYLDVLLYWNEIDPPSEYEIIRNQMIFSEQGNRNPFVDFYDQGFADILFSFGDPEVADR